MFDLNIFFIFVKLYVVVVSIIYYLYLCPTVTKRLKWQDVFPSLCFFCRRIEAFESLLVDRHKSMLRFVSLPEGGIEIIKCLIPPRGNQTHNRYVYRRTFVLLLHHGSEFHGFSHIVSRQWKSEDKTLLLTFQQIFEMLHFEWRNWFVCSCAYLLETNMKIT